MNKPQAIFTVLLAASEAEPLALHVVTARVLQRWPGGIVGVGDPLDLKTCGRSLSQMFARGRVSRVRTKLVAGYCYYLSSAQRARCFAPVVYPHAAAFTANGGHVTGLGECVRFLQRLKGLPAFTGVAVVDAMLADYTRAHAAAVSVEEFHQQRADDAMAAERNKHKQARRAERAAVEAAVRAEAKAARKAVKAGGGMSGAAQREIV